MKNRLFLSLYLKNSILHTMNIFTRFFYSPIFIVLFLVSIIEKGQAQNTTSDFASTFDQAEVFMSYSDYKMALERWLICYDLDSLNANVNFKVGYSYLLSNSEKPKALKFLQYASKNISRKYRELDHNEKDAPTYTLYWLAHSYHLNNLLDSAEVVFKRYKQNFKLDKEEIKEIDRQLVMISNARELEKNPVSLIFHNMGDSVNTQYPDFAPVISADESMMIFTSRRDNSTGEQLDEDGSYFEDIYVSHKKDTGWTSAKHIGYNINTTGHEATINLTADGQHLFIYRSSLKDNGDIFMSTLVGDEWSVPKRLGPTINNPDSWETHAGMTPDGQTLYFVSDRKGGIGGRDIYMAKKLPDGEWGMAVNAGPVVNTSYDEDGVFIHPDGRHLYFASNNDKSMGGFDIFVTTINEDGSFSPPENIGYPLNSADDDVFFVVSADGKRAYFSSAHNIDSYAKDQSRGDKDIYVLNLVDATFANVTLLKGIVYPGTDLSALNNIQIDVMNADNNELMPMETRVNSKTGKFLIIMAPGKNYKISYDLGKYGKSIDTVMVPTGSAYREINKEIDLTQPNPFAPKLNAVIAREDKFKADKNGVIRAEVLKNDEAQGSRIVPTTLEIVDKPVHGKLEVDRFGVITYTPDKDFQGMELLSYIVKNNKGVVSNECGVQIAVGDTSTKKPVVLADAGDKGPKTKGGKTKPTKPVIKGTCTPELSYVAYFGYNKKKIAGLKRWQQFVADAMACIEENGSVNVILEASASKVPTKTYRTNENLAERRSIEAKIKLQKSIKARGGDWSKVNFVEVKTLVQGPDYNKDKKDKDKYIKYQYIKFTRK